MKKALGISVTIVIILIVLTSISLSMRIYYDNYHGKLIGKQVVIAYSAPISISILQNNPDLDLIVVDVTMKAITRDGIYFREVENSDRLCMVPWHQIKMIVYKEKE